MLPEASDTVGEAPSFPFLAARMRAIVCVHFHVAAREGFARSSR
jgi:hypothetical protein